jgi:leucyl-tRNA synthetase
LLLSPFAPHIAEELWELLGHAPSISQQPWPSYDESKTVLQTITMAIQVQGKLRGTISVSKDEERETILSLAKEIPAVAKQLENKEIKKTILVPNKIVNFIVG